ncbi:hypothetical protein GCM10017562_33220 [Streptomyces roseofulvus]
MRSQFEEDREEIALQTGVAGLEVDDLHAGTVAQPRPRAHRWRPRTAPRPEIPGPPSHADAILSP